MRRELVRRALEIGKGSARVRDSKGKFHIVSSEMNCPDCGRAFEPLDPTPFLLQFAARLVRALPRLWRSVAGLFGARNSIRYSKPSSRRNAAMRLLTTAKRVRARSAMEHASTKPLAAFSFMAKRLPASRDSAADASLKIIQKLKFRGNDKEIAADILTEITQRLRFLCQVGLSYLTLDRAANSLSGGESQRIRLAAQLGSNLRGVLYVLDEPTIGLHARDNSRLLEALETLARQGNSLVIVEHDEETMRRADHIIDLGPHAGARGGEVVATGQIRGNYRQSEFAHRPMLEAPDEPPVRGAPAESGGRSRLDRTRRRASP